MRKNVLLLVASALAPMVFAVSVATAADCLSAPPIVETYGIGSSIEVADSIEFDGFENDQIFAAGVGLNPSESTRPRAVSNHRSMIIVALGNQTSKTVPRYREHRSG